MTVSKKIIPGNSQPHGGAGIVGMAGLKGLTAANKISSNHQVSPFPPLLATQIDQPSGVINARLQDRFSLVNAYWPNSPSGAAVNP